MGGRASWYTSRVELHARQRGRRVQGAAQPGFTAGPQTDGLAPMDDVAELRGPERDWNAMMKKVRASSRA